MVLLVQLVDAVNFEIAQVPEGVVMVEVVRKLLV